VVAISHSVAAQARQVCGARVPVTAVHNAVDLGRFAPAGPAADLDALAGLPPAAPGTVRVGLVATLGRWKGHEAFLRALARLPEDAGVRGYVVGGGLYVTDGSQHTVEELRALARDLGVAHRVGFTGYVDEPAAAMRALDVVVHASTAPEPFGLVIAEAMACGRALVASAAGGAAELIEPGVTALAHAPGDEAGLAACIARLAGSAALRARLGASGRACAERRFDRARLAGEVGRVYRAAGAG
jgi:glycosyltransferase involved in cell wall biosynthesis